MSLNEADFGPDFRGDATPSAASNVEAKMRTGFGQMLTDFAQRMGLAASPRRRTRSDGNHEMKIEPAIVSLEERIV